MLAQMPELMTMFDHPDVHGALQSILGRDYYIHLHHATVTDRLPRNHMLARTLERATPPESSRAVRVIPRRQVTVIPF